MRYIRCELPNAASYAILAEFGEAGFNVEAIFTWAQHDDPIFRRNRWQFMAILPVLCPLLTKADKNLTKIELEICNLILDALNHRWESPHFQSNFSDLVTRQKLQRKLLLGNFDRPLKLI